MVKMLDRNKLMENLITSSFYFSQYNVGVVVPSFLDARIFVQEFNTKLGEIPEWVRPKLLRCGVHAGIEFSNEYKIYLLYTDTSSRGRTLNELYASSRVPMEKLTPHCFTVLRCNYTTFEDV
jgi:hypothetical protein